LLREAGTPLSTPPHAADRNKTRVAGKIADRLFRGLVFCKNVYMTLRTFACYAAIQSLDVTVA